MIDILYEDNHVLAVIKPPNLPVQADASGDPDMLTLLKGYVKERYGKPGAVYLGLVHRLDRPVGGVMVFARTSKAASRLSEAMRTGAFVKGYRALVRGEAADYACLVNYIVKDEASNTSRVVIADTPSAKRAELSYRTLERARGMSLLEIELATGRHHQIRVQLSHAGLPIWGDARYGNGRPGQQIALQAHWLVFPHPTREEDIEVVMPMKCVLGLEWDMRYGTCI